jgi:hypothetical protein
MPGSAATFLKRGKYSRPVKYPFFSFLFLGFQPLFVMKKLFLLALLAVASTTGAFAQARAGGELSSKDYTGGGVTGSRNTGFGIKGGYNLNGLRGDDIKGIERNSRQGFHAGAYGQLGFNEFASLQVELLYSRQGFTANTGTNNGSQTYGTDYLLLPVMFVGNLTETLSFHVGPQVGVMTNLQRAGENLAIADAGFNSFDYGGVAGVEARVGPARVGARYNLFLSKVFEDGQPATPVINPALANSDLYNNLFQLYVGIGFTQ